MFRANLRHAQLYLERIKSLNRVYLQSGDRIIEALHGLDDDLRQIVKARDWASEQVQESEAARACCDISYFGARLLGLRRSRQELIRWSQQGLQAARHLDDKEREAAHLRNWQYPHLQ